MQKLEKPAKGSEAGPCWEVPERPTAQLLARLKAGTLAVEAGVDEELVTEHLARCRREQLAIPAIFVGSEHSNRKE